MENNFKQEYFDIASVDSMTWLENAEFLKLSAYLIFENVLRTYKNYSNAQRKVNLSRLNIGEVYKKRNEVNELEDKLKSYSNSYYLLIGYSFENLIKALSIENNPGLTFKEIYEKHWRKFSSGHGISAICKENFENLSTPDFEILERLEAYILWLGKYPVAIDKIRHLADYDKKYFFSNDQNENDILFDKIRNILIEKRENKLR
jgi:hypothetical protein